MDLSKDAKQKTIETLTAITGMLSSLREKKLLESDKLRVGHDKNQKIKTRFEVINQVY